MPTYEYHCEACGEHLEVFQKISADPLTTCPHCKRGTLKRGVGGGAATFRFIGEGFYVNDCKSSNECDCQKQSQ